MTPKVGRPLKPKNLFSGEVASGEDRLIVLEPDENFMTGLTLAKVRFLCISAYLAESLR